jgi:hypothetical protein
MGAHSSSKKVGASRIQSDERSIAIGDRVTFILRCPEKSNQKRRPPRLALAGPPARQVRESGPGFSIEHPARAKRSRHPCRLPLRGLSTPPHRRTGAPGRAAGHRGPHFSKDLEHKRSSAWLPPCCFPRLRSSVEAVLEASTSSARRPLRSSIADRGYRPSSTCLRAGTAFDRRSPATASRCSCCRARSRWRSS